MGVWGYLANVQTRSKALPVLGHNNLHRGNLILIFSAYRHITSWAGALKHRSLSAGALTSGAEAPEPDP